MLLLSFVYIGFSPKLGSHLAIGLLSSGIFNSLVKFLLESPRPMNLDPKIFTVYEQAQEFAFGFPSGHVQSAVVVWGILFFQVPNRWVRCFAGFVILVMPFARMYMGVHYLGDVLGGLLLGAINLGLVLWFVNRFPNFPNLSRYESQSRIARTYSLAIIAVSLSPVLLYTEGLSMAHTSSLDVVVSASSALAGFLLGSILFQIGKFQSHRDWESILESDLGLTRTGLVRFLALVLGIGLVYLLPGALLKNFEWYGNVLVRYLRYFVVGFFIVYLLPYLLIHFQGGKYLKPKSVS
jgi:hypothetical protein